MSLYLFNLIMSSHQNFLTKFKSDFWNHCMQNNLFTQEQLHNVAELTKVIDNIVSNYQSHIFQNDNPQIMYPKLVEELKLHLQSLSATTSQELKNMNLDRFHQNYEQKQSEFNSLMNKEQPKNIEFEKVEDEPLTNDKLEALIAQQMKEREHLVQQENTPQNNTMDSQVSNISPINNNNNQLANIPEENIVLTDKFIPNLPNVLQNNDSQNISFSGIESQIKTLIEKVEKMQEMQKKQNIVLNKMITSQISILEKLK